VISIYLMHNAIECRFVCQYTLCIHIGLYVLLFNFPLALSALLHFGGVLQFRFPFAISSSPSCKISTMRGDDMMYSVSSAFALDAYILMRERALRIYIRTQ
ncbi:MAG: hypothetical protein J6P74_08760, partial [Paludibacteraceae bacterium]|nr:hypothetical protein [Paludibacteraceae bacterium]